jgi:hypothetical protein
MDLLHRIRWNNVARAAAVLAAIVLVLAWPHLRSKAPEIPSGEPTAAVPPSEAPPAGEPGREVEGAPRSRAPDAEGERGRKTPARQRPVKPHRQERREMRRPPERDRQERREKRRPPERPAPPALKAAAPAPAASAPPSAPVRTPPPRAPNEFGFER